MQAIDRYAWSNRWRAYHPAEKLLLAGGSLLLAIILPPLTTGPLIIALMLLATVWGARVPIRAFWRVLFIPSAFLLTSVTFLAVSVEFNPLRLTISEAGLELATQALLRALAALSCLAFLTLTTPVIDLIALLRRLGAPSSVVDIMLLIYRLVFVFVERAASGYQAQSARLGYRNFRISIRSLGLLAVNLLQRAIAQARRLEIGLAARGFSSELRVLPAQVKLSRWRLMSIAGVLLLTALAAMLLDRMS